MTVHVDGGLIAGRAMGPLLAVGGCTASDRLQLGVQFVCAPRATMNQC